MNRTPISEQAELMRRLCTRLILDQGGQRLTAEGREAYRIRLQEPGTSD